MNNLFEKMAGPWIAETELKIVLNACKDGWYGKNAYYYVEAFENAFAKYHSRRFGLMTPNCTTALHLLLAGLGIGPGDEVIVPECTWIGSSACITYQNAYTIFADIDPVHWCVTPESIQKKITPKTKAVIVVDLYGNMPDWDGITKICKEKGIHLIEDAAEAVGSIYKGTRAGKFGVGSTFSFHRTKTITTGEGGMLLLDEPKLYERCKFLRDHGRAPGTYYNTEVTFKYMPFNIQAALGYAQLLRIDELVDKKRWIWKGYLERLKNVPDILMNPEPPGTINGAWATALIFGKSHKMTREKALDFLPKEGVPTRPFFYPLSSLPAYPGRRSQGQKENPVAYDVSSRGVNLPCALDLTEEDLDVVANGVKRILKI
jgi:perosamine synthetase